MVWGTYNHQHGDLKKFSIRSENKVPQSAQLTEGGCNRYLGSAHLNLETSCRELP